MGLTTTSSLRLRARIPLQKSILRNTLVMNGEWFFFFLQDYTVLGSRRLWSDRNFRYYSAYLAYFSEYLRDHTPNEAFERFILSSSSNYNLELVAASVQDVQSAGKEGKQHPKMLNRLLAGLVHPFIHFAYGFEFGIPGQVAEGGPRLFHS